MSMSLVFFKCDLENYPKASMPRQSTLHSAGFDIRAAEDVTIPGKLTWISKGGNKHREISKDQVWTCVPTGVKLCYLPENLYIRVAPRSGLAMKGIFVNAGVIDRDYRGEIKVILGNIGNDPFDIKVGDKIAQLIFEKIDTPLIVDVDHPPTGIPESLLKLVDEPIEEHKGFGSTGMQ